MLSFQPEKDDTSYTRVQAVVGMERLERVLTHTFQIQTRPRVARPPSFLYESGGGRCHPVPELCSLELAPAVLFQPRFEPSHSTCRLSRAGRQNFAGMERAGARPDAHISDTGQYQALRPNGGSEAIWVKVKVSDLLQ